uniref:Uncharacterized protein n=1 Tax=viral metagenome TaxID=1070528 RepID=A0A6M3KLS2_9ZZZZ
MTVGICPHGEFELEEGCPQCIAERLVIAEEFDGLNAEGLTLAKPNIVKVQYYSETTGELSPREYTYYSADPLKVGDIVIVPVRDTTGKAKVSAIDVPEAEISAFKDKVKMIPAGSIRTSPATKPPEVELPVGGLAEAARAAGAEVHAVAFENIAKNLGLIPGTDKIEQEVDTKINLCDTCTLRNDYPMCCSPDIIFGDGVGNDNIIKCGKYENGEAKPCTIPFNVLITPEPETALALRPGEDIEEQINAVVEAREKAREANCLRVASYNKWVEANQQLLDNETEAKQICGKEETTLREMAVETYLKTLDKAVAPGVGIRVMTKLDYDAKEAMEWAVKHELALKLDTAKFEKIAKTENIPFVTISEEPTATIAAELNRITIRKE